MLYVFTVLCSGASSLTVRLLCLLARLRGVVFYIGASLLPLQLLETRVRRERELDIKSNPKPRIGRKIALAEKSYCTKEDM